MTVYAGWQLTVGVGGSLDSVTGSGAGLVTLDGVQRITYDYVHNLEAKEALGQRTNYAITEGVIGLTGTIERFWTGSGTHTFLTKGAGATGSVPDRHVGIYPNGRTNGQPYIGLESVKFGRRRMVQRPGSSLLTETLDFIGTQEHTGSLSI